MTHTTLTPATAGQPVLGLITQPGTVDPHPASLSTEWDKWLPSEPTDWSIFDQVVNVIDSLTTDREQLDHVLKLYDWWSIWNQLVFRSSLKPNFLSVETADYGKWLGLCHMAPARKISISLAAYSHRHRVSDDAGHHSCTVGKRPAQFEHLTNCEWNACLILLHEMMHDCLWTSVGDHDHEGPAWAQLCNLIGREVLELPLLYTWLISRKLTAKDADGNNVMQPHSKGKTDDDGNILMVPKRYTVWSTSHKGPVPDGLRIADVSEMRCFPYLMDDPFIEMHTSVIETGKLVAKNDGQPVVVLPQF